MHVRLSLPGKSGKLQRQHSPTFKLQFAMTESNDDRRLVENSLLYKMFARQRDEILRHKWIESEKAGVDIGFEKALLGWLVKSSTAWQEQREVVDC